MGAPLGGGIVLSFRWCALGVGFGRYPNWAPETLEFLLRLSGEGSVEFDLLRNYALRKETARRFRLILSFVGVRCWFSTSLFRGGSVLSYRRFAQGVAFGRPDWRRYRLILTMARLMCRFWTLS